MRRFPIQQMPRYFREVIWAQMGDMPMFRYMRDGLADLLRQTRQRTLEVVRALHAAGVRLHLGSDTAGLRPVYQGRAHVDDAHDGTAGSYGVTSCHAGDSPCISA